MEGGIGFGLGAALRDAITLTGGVVDQANFDTYLPLRISDMPKVEVHIVASTEAADGRRRARRAADRSSGGQRGLQGDRASTSSNCRSASTKPATHSGKAPSRYAMRVGGREARQIRPRAFLSPFVAAERGYIDEVVMPHSTRRRLSRVLAMLRNKKLENPWKKHDNIPL